MTTTKKKAGCPKASKAMNTEDFIRAWQTSASVPEVAEHMKASKNTASTRASWLRKRGVALKSMRLGRIEHSKEQLAAWAKLAKSLEK